MRRIAVLIVPLLLVLAPVVWAGAAPDRSGLSDSGRQSDTLDPCGQPLRAAGPVPENLVQKVNAAGERPTVIANVPRNAPERKTDLPKARGGAKGTIYFFLGSLCPCTDAHKHSIVQLLSLAPNRGIKPVAIFPNRGESVELVEHFFKGLGFTMTYVIDSTNRLVVKFGAKKTPEVFLVDARGKVVYSGPIDDSVENLGQVKNAYLKNAVLDLSAGRPVAVPKAEGSGCWIVRNR